MEDAKSKKKRVTWMCASIQETRREQKPARMVGHLSLESALLSKNAGRSTWAFLQQGREG